MNLLEVLCDELRPVVGNDSRFNARILLFGTLQNDLDVSLGHPFAKIPMNQETAVAVQDAAQVVERRANVQVGNINMPMLVRLRRLFKTRPFLASASVRFQPTNSDRSVLKTCGTRSKICSSRNLLALSRFSISTKASGSIDPAFQHCYMEPRGVRSLLARRPA